MAIMSQKSINGFIYHVNVMKRRHRELVAKLTDLGMDPEQAERVTIDNLAHHKPLPIHCTVCCEFYPGSHPHPDICPQCNSDKIDVIAE